MMEPICLKKQSRKAFRPGPPGKLYPQTGIANGSVPAPSPKTDFLPPIPDPYLPPTPAQQQNPSEKPTPPIFLAPLNPHSYNTP